MRRQLLLLSLLVILPALHAAAQASVGVIVYAEGYEITVLRDDVRISLDAGLGEALGEPVYAGDQITTDGDTSAEIQLLTSRNIVKVAESTTFTVTELREGRSSLGVTYGRLRARVDQLAGTGSFELRGISAIAGVRGTDFAYDQVLDPVSGELFNRVSCFEGEVTVAATARPEASATIGPGESVVAPAAAEPEQAAFEPVPQAVQTFWAERPFVRDPAPAGQILDEFPGVLDRAEERLGVAPQMGIAAADEPGPSPEDTPAGSDGETDSAPAAEEGPGDTGTTPPAGDAPRVIERERGGAGADEEEDEDAASPDETERRERIARGFRTTGVVLTGAGLVTDLVAIGLFYFGEDIVPGWTAANNDYLQPVAIAGVGMLTFGLISIVVSLAVSP